MCEPNQIDIVLTNAKLMKCNGFSSYFIKQKNKIILLRIVFFMLFFRWNNNIITSSRGFGHHNMTF